jgi:hypothetical protein
MSKLITATFIVAMTLVISPALAQPTPTSSGSASPAATSTAAALPKVQHLVYQFGYNTDAASSGDSTGTSTIDITGLANDGGMTVTGTDEWWMAVQPKQTNTCEVDQDGSVICAQAPYAITAIQLAVAPLLGQNYFTSLASSPTSTWKQSYKVRATFLPGAGSGFAGQVYTWNCDYNLTGKGTYAAQPPLILVHSEGEMKQQGGRYITVKQKADILFDPRIQMPVYVDEAITFIPQLSTNSYTIQLKLIRT